MPAFSPRTACLALLLATASACASSSPPRLPPLTAEPTRAVSAGKFVWVDLVTEDVATARSFYGALFGWSFRAGDRYTEIVHQGQPIGGVVEAASDVGGSRWVGNLSVADVDRAADFVREHGGVVLREPVEAPERGRLALVRDPEGALLLLLRSTGGDPPDAEPETGSWLWRELWTQDVEAAKAFYTQLAGYQAETVQLEGHAYPVLSAGGKPRAGLVAAPPEVRAQWLPYVRVAEPEALARRAEQLGARIVMQDENTAILVDPLGAPIGIQSWETIQTGAAQ